ncbi:MAG: hypothetical protein H6R17_1158 [Proteobacteria bacterium]|nr:hypothetical protein [Pseudomonadota bacterium]
MKLTTADVPQLQLSLAATLLMVALGAVSVHLSLSSTRAAKTAQTAAQKERDEIDGKLRRVRSEEAEIKQKSAEFANLQARGVVGEEQRLEWVELLKAIGERHRLLDLHYEIAPQRALDTAPGSAYAFYASTMKVQLGLLHEEDLTRLLDDLRQYARALIQVRSCKVWRLPRDDRTAQLQADCLIDWITVRASAGAKR